MVRPWMSNMNIKEILNMCIIYRREQSAVDFDDYYYTYLNKSVLMFRYNWIPRRRKGIFVYEEFPA